jgi:hypothetical protein
MKKLLIGILCVATLGLTGCYSESPDEHDIRMGKLCAEAGGSWTHSDWDGSHCEIKAKS